MRNKHIVKTARSTACKYARGGDKPRGLFLSLGQKRQGVQLLCGVRQPPPRIKVPRGRHSGGCRHGTDRLRGLLDIVLGAACEVVRGRLARHGVQVAEHEYAAALGAGGLLNELARLHVAPEGDPEGRLDVSPIVLIHHAADVLRGLAGVVEGDGGDQVVADVRADDVVEEVGVDEAQVAINGGGRAARERPRLVVVVRHAGVGVLEEGDGNFE